MRAHLTATFTFGVLVVMTAIALILGEYWTAFFARCVTWMFLAISFIIAYSFARIPSIAQATLFAIGAYVTVWLAPSVDGDLVLLLPAAFAGGAAGALLLGLLVYRMTLNGAAIATIIIAVIGFVIGNAAVPITGGANGLALPSVDYAIAGLNVPVGPSAFMLLLGTAMLAVLLIASIKISKTHTWTVVRAIQQNETRARVLGYNVNVYRLSVFCFSGGTAGVGGGLYALISLHITTDLLSLMMSFKAILWAVVGGAGTLFGGPLGVLAVQVITEVISRYTVRVDMAIGLILIIIALFFPQGLLGMLRPLEGRSPKRVPRPDLAAEPSRPEDDRAVNPAGSR